MGMAGVSGKRQWRDGGRDLGRSERGVVLARRGVRVPQRQVNAGEVPLWRLG